ncbi:hypothetical protein [Cohnella lupini]|uniref:EamA-like transporter family protein n=1 Tax=Cohnella lupini TaxID=1294267 RepID=A0A3D9IA60_9BACL|nr:hypothetical protein [Cohnella lupini]RED58607.1 hypothetical protein DFP95_108133 [Cohnella lupini]
MIVQTTGFALILMIWSFVRIQSLVSKQKFKVAAVYGGLMGVSTLVGCLLIARVDVPSTIIPFKMIFEPIGKLILTQ